MATLRISIREVGFVTKILRLAGATLKGESPCSIEKIFVPEPAKRKPSAEEIAVPGLTKITSLPVEVRLCANKSVGDKNKSVSNLFMKFIIDQGKRTY